MPMTLAASMPPITVVPMIWRATDPAPVAVHNGTQPKNERERRHQNRPQAQPGAFERRVHQRSFPFRIRPWRTRQSESRSSPPGRSASPDRSANTRRFRSAPCKAGRNAPSTTRRSHSTANAPNTATGVLNRTLNGSVQLSYSAARIRKTNSSENPKITAGGTPCCAFFSWNDMPM